MNKPYLVRFWHGTPREDSFFMKKCIGLFRRQDADGTLFWDGTLQEFADKWKDTFLYLPYEGGTSNHPVRGTICITPHGSFNQR